MKFHLSKSCIGLLICLLSCKNKSAVIFEKSNKKSNGQIAQTIKADYKKHIYLKGIVNDSIEGNFVFDTGVCGFYLDSTFFNTMKTTDKVMNYRARGVGEGFQRIQVLNRKLGVRFDSLNYFQNFTPLMQLKKIGGRNIDGLIGYDAFKNNVVKIDYKKQYIQIIDPSDFNVPRHYQKIPLIIENHEIYLKMNIEISDSIAIAGNFLFDTGSQGALILTNDMVKKHDLKKRIIKKTAYYSSAFGVGGTSSGYDLISKSINISQFRIKNQIVSFSNDTTGALSGQHFLGIAGNKLFEKFDLIIDFPHKELYLKPSHRFHHGNKMSLLGFSYTDRTDITEGWIVTFLYKNSNAEKAGLKFNDIVISINGIGVKEISQNQLAKFSKSSRVVSLKIIRNGEIKTIEFRTCRIIT